MNTARDRRRIGLVLTTLVLVVLTGCSDSPTAGGASETGNTGLGKLRIEMFDAPPAIDSLTALYLSIREIAVNSSQGWITVTDDSLSIDFLELVNGVRQVVADTTLPPGRYSQIRLVLGTENSARTTDSIFPLWVPSGIIRVHCDFSIAANSEVTLLMDLDVSRSLSVDGDRYKLEPSFTVFEEQQSATIGGSVLTPDMKGVAKVTVEALSATDTTSTITGRDGAYLLTLPAGIWTIQANDRHGRSADTAYGSVELQPGTQVSGFTFILSDQ